MFALVLWKGSHEISVVPYEHVKSVKGKFSAKWGSSCYPVQLLKLNENKDWLESLEVTTDGTIIPTERRSSISSDLLMKKKSITQKEKIFKSAKNDEAIKMNKKVMETNSIFSDDSPFDLKKKNVSKDPYSYNNDSADESDEDRKRDSDDNESEKSNEKTVENQIKKVCICSQLTISADDIEKFKLILNVARTIYFKQNMSHEEKSEEIPERMFQREATQELVSKKSVKVKIFKEAGIIVDECKVRNIHNIYKKSPREMVRQLMKLMVGEDELRMSSPTGKNGWNPIPSNIFEAVEQFVNENAEKKKYTISHRKYREVLTAMCATLRSAANVKKEGKKSTKQLQNKNQGDDEKGDGSAYDMDEMEEANFSMKLDTNKKKSEKSRKRKVVESNDVNLKRRTKQ